MFSSVATDFGPSTRVSCLEKYFMYNLSFHIQVGLCCYVMAHVNTIKFLLLGQICLSKPYRPKSEHSDQCLRYLLFHLYF